MRKPQTRLNLVETATTIHKPTANNVREWIEACQPLAVLNVLVTPEIAAVFLEYNRPGETNRKISERYIASATRTLEHHEWLNTGEPIIVSDTRLLNDGQHRLEAIVRSGVPAIMDLRFGVPREAFAATNSGRKRSAGDAMMMVATTNHIQVASAARMVLAYEEGLPRSLYRTASNREVVAMWERCPELGEAVTLATSVGRGFKNSIVYALAFFALRTANRAAVDEFFSVMKTGEGRIENPAHRLREFIIRSMISQDREKRVLAMALAIIAWNEWNGGKRQMGELSWRMSRPFPEVQGLKL